MLFTQHRIKIAEAGDGADLQTIYDVDRVVERSVDRKAELMASIAPVDDEGRP